MRRKEIAASPGPAPAPLDELRVELESLGVAPEEAGPLARRLAEMAELLPEREFRSLLNGVVMGGRAIRHVPRSSPELGRILEDFASELKKLDEGLRLLTAFLTRLRDQTAGPALPATSRTLH